jgi:hypothetical protein
MPIPTYYQGQIFFSILFVNVTIFLGNQSHRYRDKGNATDGPLPVTVAPLHIETVAVTTQLSPTGLILKGQRHTSTSKTLFSSRS